MTEDQESKDLQSILADEWAQAWMEEHLPGLKKSAYGQRLLYQSLAIAFVIGLVAQVGGYFLLASQPKEPLGLLADLLHALGWSLWTGVVVALFIQVIPEVKQRQIRQAIEAYEALKREKSQVAGKGELAGPGSSQPAEPSAPKATDKRESDSEESDSPG